MLRLFLKSRIPTSRNTGKITPARIPFFRLSDNAPDTKPTSVGPPEQPTSPANANKANKEVPPLRNASDALLKLPGHMIPTENPQIEQPISDKNADGAREIQR